MLEGGPVVDYFKNWAADPKNTIVFVSYQIEGTLGKRVQKGVSEVTTMDNYGKMAVAQVKLQVESIEAFSGHSDRRQLIAYLTHLKPKPERVFFVHGEKSKIMNLANFVDAKAGINAGVPSVLEPFRLL